MRRIFVALIGLILCLSLMLCSCERSDSGDSVDTEPQTDSDETQETPLSEEDQIKQKVLDLMTASEEKKDPGVLFSRFDGDYEISGFLPGSQGVNGIKRKNAVSVVSCNQLEYYGVEAAAHFFYAADYNGEAEVIAALPLQADDSAHSTIFTAFGMDTGALYGAEETDGDDAKLTADMLTVSDDKSTCEISKAYIDEMAKPICEAMGYDDEQTTYFLEHYEGSGIYSVAENKITLEISFHHATLGKIHQKTSYAVDEYQRVTAYSLMEYSNPSLGLDTPIINEVTYKNVVYQGNEPVSATIQTKSVTDKSRSIEGHWIEEIQTVRSTFILGCEIAEKPKCTARQEKTNVTSSEGQSYTENTLLIMTVDLSKTSSQFSFSRKYDGLTASLQANKITFATPATIPQVPDRVTNAITKYIMDKF